jgi:beta-glucosidase
MVLFYVIQAAAAEPGAEALQPWKDPAQPLELRVRDLVGRMTLEEKARQVCNVAPAIPRIGLPAYDYWNECLHGVGAQRHRHGFSPSHRHGGQF